MVRSSSFEHVFQATTWQYVADESLFFNLSVPVPAGSFETVNPALTSETESGEARGKFVLLPRFEGSPDVGVDLTYWPENQRFRTTKGLIYAIEDRYQDPGEDHLIMTHLEEARRRAPKDLYLTFTSAVGLRAHSYAQTINPRLNDYLARSSPGRVAIIAMDYFEEPRELVSNVLKMNPMTGTAVGHDLGTSAMVDVSVGDCAAAPTDSPPGRG